MKKPSLPYIPSHLPLSAVTFAEAHFGIDHLPQSTFSANDIRGNLFAFVSKFYHENGHSVDTNWRFWDYILHRLRAAFI
jgi:hypothetical protein